MAPLVKYWGPQDRRPCLLAICCAAYTRHRVKHVLDVMSSLQKDEETSFYEYQGNRVATAVFYVCTASDRIGGGGLVP